MPERRVRPTRILALNAPRAAAFEQTLDLVHTEPVEITGNGMFQAGGGDGELERLLGPGQRLQAVDQPAGKTIAPAHPVHNVRDVVVTAGEKLLAVGQTGRPSVV